MAVLAIATLFCAVAMFRPALVIHYLYVAATALCLMVISGTVWLRICAPAMVIVLLLPDITGPRSSPSISMRANVSRPTPSR